MFGLFHTPGSWFLRGRSKYVRYHSVRCLVAVSLTRSCNRAVQGYFLGLSSLFLMKFYLDPLSKSRHHLPLKISILLLFCSWCLPQMSPVFVLSAFTKILDWICFLEALPGLDDLCSIIVNDTCSAPTTCIRHCTKGFISILSFNPLNNLLRYFHLHMW